MNKAIYAFSGDPITYGHIDVILRARQVFDHLVVAIGNNPSKKCLFTLDERLALAREALKGLSPIEVVVFDGMLSDFAFEQNASHIIRGIRNSEDFNYELMLHQVNQSQRVGLETFFIPCSQDKTHISSGAAKAILLEQGMIHEYVPFNVKKALEHKIRKQRIIGVTGSIGAGKSTFCKNQIKSGIDQPIHHIDLDQVAHDILENKVEPAYQAVRNKIQQAFGQDIMTSGGFINRKILGDIIFNDNKQLKVFNELMRIPILTSLRRKLHKLHGLIFVESALLIEAEWTFLCNHEVVLLEVNDQTQKDRLLNRGLSQDQIERRINSQFSFETKKGLLKNKIKETGFGQIYTAKSFDETLRIMKPETVSA